MSSEYDVQVTEVDIDVEVSDVNPIAVTVLERIGPPARGIIVSMERIPFTDDAGDGAAIRLDMDRALLLGYDHWLGAGTARVDSAENPADIQPAGLRFQGGSDYHYKMQGYGVNRTTLRFTDVPLRFGMRFMGDGFTDPFGSLQLNDFTLNGVDMVGAVLLQVINAHNIYLNRLNFISNIDSADGLPSVQTAGLVLVENCVDARVEACLSRGSAGHAYALSFGQLKGEITRPGNHPNRISFVGLTALDSHGSGINASACEGVEILGYRGYNDVTNGFLSPYAFERIGNNTSWVRSICTHGSGYFRGRRWVDLRHSIAMASLLDDMGGPAIVVVGKDSRTFHCSFLGHQIKNACRVAGFANFLTVEEDDEEEGTFALRSGVSFEGADNYEIAHNNIESDYHHIGPGKLICSTASASMTIIDNDYLGQTYACAARGAADIGAFFYADDRRMIGKILSIGSRTFYDAPNGTGNVIATADFRGITIPEELELPAGGSAVQTLTLDAPAMISLGTVGVLTSGETYRTRYPVDKNFHIPGRGTLVVSAGATALLGTGTHFVADVLRYMQEGSAAFLLDSSKQFVGQFLSITNNFTAQLTAGAKRAISGVFYVALEQKMVHGVYINEKCIDMGPSWESMSSRGHLRGAAHVVNPASLAPRAKPITVETFDAITLGTGAARRRFISVPYQLAEYKVGVAKFEIIPTENITGHATNYIRATLNIVKAGVVSAIANAVINIDNTARTVGTPITTAAEPSRATADVADMLVSTERFLLTLEAQGSGSTLPAFDVRATFIPATGYVE